MNNTTDSLERLPAPSVSVAPVAGDGWRLLRVWETAMVESLPKNDDTVEWWNGEAWDLCPALNLSPHEFYRTRALPRSPLNPIADRRKASGRAPVRLPDYSTRAK